jgi:hypothetical protein
MWGAGPSHAEELGEERLARLQEPPLVVRVCATFVAEEKASPRHRSRRARVEGATDVLGVGDPTRQEHWKAVWKRGAEALE